VIALRAGELEAAFAPEAGMVCASLRHRGEELLGLRKGLEAYAASGSTFGIPLLYPWANRLSARRFGDVDLDRAPHRFRDDAMHGALPVAWTLEDHDDASVRARFDWGADGELMAAFPFAHAAVYEAALDDRTLRITVTVEEPVPVAFGFHPYFVVGPGAYVEVPVRERLVLDERKLPTGEREPAQPLSGPLDRSYDDAFGAPTGPCLLSAAGREIAVLFDRGYGYAQVFAPPGEDVISFEPMTAPANALVTGEGLITGPHTATFAIEVRA